MGGMMFNEASIICLDSPLASLSISFPYTYILKHYILPHILCIGNMCTEQDSYHRSTAASMYKCVPNDSIEFLLSLKMCVVRVLRNILLLHDLYVGSIY